MPNILCFLNSVMGRRKKIQLRKVKEKNVSRSVRRVCAAVLQQWQMCIYDQMRWTKFTFTGNYYSITMKSYLTVTEQTVYRNYHYHNIATEQNILQWLQLQFHNLWIFHNNFNQSRTTVNLLWSDFTNIKLRLPKMHAVALVNQQVSSYNRECKHLNRRAETMLFEQHN